MGLYLVVFAGDDDDKELAGVEVGGYDDFNEFRTLVATILEDGAWGSRFPILMLHEDSAGSWTPADAMKLIVELRDIETALSARPAALAPLDVNGDPLIARLRELAETAVARSRPIEFQ